VAQVGWFTVEEIKCFVKFKSKKACESGTSPAVLIPILQLMDAQVESLARESPARNLVKLASRSWRWVFLSGHLTLQRLAMHQS